MNKKYLSSLTPLRGIAAMLVVMYHSETFIYPLTKPGTTALISYGWIWVDFFFVLSGFIITHVYKNNFIEGVSRKNYKKYMIARFARVYPLHLLTLIWAVAVGIGILGNERALGPWNSFFQVVFNFKTAIPTSLFLLQGMHFHPMAPLNSPSWSLSTEWWMYLFFPFLICHIHLFGRRKRLLLLLGIIFLYIGLKYYIVPTFGRQMGNPMPPTINTITDFAFLRCLAGFMLGLLAYEWYNVDWASSTLGSTQTFLVLSFILLIFLHFDVNELIIVALFPLIIIAAAYNTTAICRAFNRNLWQKLGDWSFSIYMVHMPVYYTYRWLAAKFGLDVPEGIFIQGVPKYTIGWLYFAAYLATTLFIASLTYQWIEIKAREYINRKAGK